MTDPKEYETIARSNESIRDSMDGKLNEPRKVQSAEGKTCTGNCESCECHEDK